MHDYPLHFVQLNRAAVLKGAATLLAVLKDGWRLIIGGRCYMVVQPGKCAVGFVVVDHTKVKESG